MSELPRSGSTAFVLAGGGAKGSFEVGALQYLIGEEGITPDIVTAASAGALAASVLAQARTLGEFVQRVQEIEDDILAMTRTDLVFGQQAWLQALQGTELGNSIASALTEGTRPPFPLGETRSRSEATGGRRRVMRRARRRRRRRMFRLLLGAGFRLPKARRKLRTSGSSALNLQPLADALRQGGPSGIGPIDQSLINRPGLQLRLAVTALRAGVLRYVTEDGTIVEDDALTPALGSASGPVDLVDGAVASASVPLVFPPHPMADDDYVDGGVLQIIPVHAAVQLGATRIIAVAAIPLALARDEHDYTTATAPHIGLRAMGMIGLAHRQRDNLAAALPPGTTLTTIDPVVDIVGLFEIEPGLLRINMDYGWLRAADVMAVGDAAIVAEVAAQTHMLVAARFEAWKLEETLWAQKVSAGSGEAGTLAMVRERKEQIRLAVEQRKQLGFPVPAECASWWSEFEVHAGTRPPHLPSGPTDRG
ncbi:MAG TPA: patatin-like phospholipase family protein [Acidimicrobiales bacterium]|nr:patatin-like phospholipase family protein [Acidimicrobiales bacterium]